MNYLEVHDPQKFRKKAKGVQVIPFAMKDFYYRIAADEQDKLNKQKTKLSAAELKKRVADMKSKREKEKFTREKRLFQKERQRLAKAKQDAKEGKIVDTREK